MPIAAIVMIALTSPAAANAHFGDPVRVPVRGMTEVIEAFADTAHPPALLGSDQSGSGLLAHQDAKGRWHRLSFSGTPIGARLVPLENGDGLVVWQKDATVYGLRFHRDGTQEAPQPVLVGIDPPYNAVKPGKWYPQWTLGFDHRGTVVVVGVTGAGAGLSAAVRDPGGRFGAERTLAATGRTGLPFPILSPISADGTVNVTWSSGDTRYWATRNGRADHFGTPVLNRPPTWPEGERPQYRHFDVRVDDLDAAEQAALALGATRLPGGGETTRIMADPVGHPFCLLKLLLPK